MYIEYHECSIHGNVYHYNGKCGDCQKIEQEEEKLEFFQKIENKTIQEQVDWLKNWVYEHAKNHAPNIMRF
jgi:hypothetical protein